MSQVRRRYRPGSKALREIVKCQASTELLLPRAPFLRLVKDVTTSVSGAQPKRYTSEAVHVLQLAVEDYMTGLMGDAFLCSLHAKRVTMLPKDIMLARRIRGPSDPGNQ
jgi:histone H3